jgi:hypothetical protein
VLLLLLLIDVVAAAIAAAVFCCFSSVHVFSNVRTYKKNMMFERSVRNLGTPRSNMAFKEFILSV